MCCGGKLMACICACVHVHTHMRTNPHTHTHPHSPPRSQVAALSQELQERAKEQMEWLGEMDGMRRWGVGGRGFGWERLRRSCLRVELCKKLKFNPERLRRLIQERDALAAGDRAALDKVGACLTLYKTIMLNPFTPHACLYIYIPTTTPKPLAAPHPSPINTTPNP